MGVARRARRSPAPRPSRWSPPARLHPRAARGRRWERPCRTRRAPPAAGEERRGGAGHLLVRVGVFNPGFWNDNGYTRAHNNCYNYASNGGPNPFASRVSGAATGITDHLRRGDPGALCDGMHRRSTVSRTAETSHFGCPGCGARSLVHDSIGTGAEGGSGGISRAAPRRGTTTTATSRLHPEPGGRGPYTLFCGYFYRVQQPARADTLKRDQAAT